LYTIVVVVVEWSLLLLRLLAEMVSFHVISEPFISFKGSGTQLAKELRLDRGGRAFVAVMPHHGATEAVKPATRWTSYT